jgi:hypothetical protein
LQEDLMRLINPDYMAERDEKINKVGCYEMRR